MNNLLSVVLSVLLEVTPGEAFIQGILNGLQNVATMVVNFFTTLFTAIIGIIWSNGALTIVGWLMLMGLGFAAFWFVFRWIRGLIRFK